MRSSRAPRRIFDIDGHAHFVTFSCYHRLPLLGRDRCKHIAVAHLNLWSGRLGVGVVGFVAMPDHMHALLRPLSSGRLSEFMKQWKNQSSAAIHEYLGLGTPKDQTPFGKRCRDARGKLHVWQARYYGFNVYSPAKAIEKLEYMHNNPVKAGLVSDPTEWKWSSAAHYLKGTPCSVRIVPYDGPLPRWLEVASGVYQSSLKQKGHPPG